jgi:hypothetical protein
MRGFRAGVHSSEKGGTVDACSEIWGVASAVNTFDCDR